MVNNEQFADSLRHKGLMGSHLFEIIPLFCNCHCQVVDLLTLTCSCGKNELVTIKKRGSSQSNTTDHAILAVSY